MKSITVEPMAWEEKIVTDVKCPYCGTLQEVEGNCDFETILHQCYSCDKSFYIKTKIEEYL